MEGQEHIGVTIVIRELWLDPHHYDTMLHFFSSTAWNLTDLRKWWIKVVLKTGVLYQENGMPVMVGDGTKKSKEGKKMTCVKRLHQESEDLSKPSYIFGHMFGIIGVLAGDIPIMITCGEKNHCAVLCTCLTLDYSMQYHALL